MGNRVHSGPMPSRQGGRHSTIVRCRGLMSHSTRNLVPGVLRDALLAPAADAGDVEFG